MRPLPLVAAVGAIAAVVALGTAPAGSAPRKLTLRVSYEKRECSTAKPEPTAVTAGRVELRRPGGKAVELELEEDGPSPERFAVPGRGPILATLVVETERVRVLGGSSSGGDARRIALGRVVKLPKNGILSFLVRDSEDSGAVNTLVELVRSAREAFLASPKKLNQVVALVDTGAKVRHDSYFQRPNRIVIAGDGDEWEPDAIAHEYGHFLLYEIAPFEGPAVDHDLIRSYPEKPKLAWDEGFPSAFSAVVHSSWHGVMPLKCRPLYRLNAKPAFPDLATARDKRYAQYSELRVAAATYQLIGWLGGSTKGLTRLLDGLLHYRRAGHAAWAARDLRDLAAKEFEESPADHVAVDKVFEGQRISWLRSFSVAVDLQSLAQAGGNYMKPELALHITGPGGFDCRATSDYSPTATLPSLDDGRPVAGIKVAGGGLSFSADDDCYLLSGDGLVSGEVSVISPLSGAATMPFPYLPGLAHWSGDFTVRAKYVCATGIPAPLPPFLPFCPPSAKVTITAISRNEDPAVPRTYTGVVLVRNVDQTVATFRADGECRVFAPGGDLDCSL